MSERAKELISKRGQIKAKVTRFKRFVDNVKVPEEIPQLQLRLEKIKDCWQAFEDIQSEIETLEVEGDEERVEFEDAYFDTVARAVGVIQASMPRVGGTEQIGHDLSPVKLPVINLPIFHGAYDEWVTFYDTFKSLIHDNVSLSGIQKFHYLRSTLRGDALQVISSLSTSEQNYDTAWRLLIQRFENKRFIISMHVKALFEIPRVERESSFALRQLLDHTNKHLRALKVLGEPVEHWNSIVIHLVTSKLDTVTHKEWEATLQGNDMPDSNALLHFIQRRCQILESVGTRQLRSKAPSASFHHGKGNSLFSSVSSSSVRCKLCGKSHNLFQCKSFLNKSVTDRLREVKRLGLCINCLKAGHQTKDCQSSSCRTCDKKHNTLLHISCQSSLGEADIQKEEERKREVTTKSQPLFPHTSDSHSESSITCFSRERERVNTILLSTAVVWAHDSQGSQHPFRVLLDSGSQSNFISERMVQFLKLRRKKGYSSVSGIAGSETRVYSMVNATLQSRISDYKVSLDFLVLPRISRDIPCFHLDVSSLQLPSGIQLADPDFHRPQRVDGLLGAEVFWDLMRIGQWSHHSTMPKLQRTALGWIVGGRVGSHTVTEQIHNNTISFISIHEQLQQFWHIEECTKLQSTYSPEQSECEKHFVNNFKRDREGRFILKLPTKPSIAQLGESRDVAIRRFLHLERRLQRDDNYRAAYVTFMEDYARQRHMEIIPASETSQGNVYYIPHHAVIKPSSSTTKLRVVFDASCKSSSGLSLNDVIMVGPTVQDDVFSILTRFRLHKYAMTADIQQMYRQIRIEDEDTNLQRIIWRSNPNSPLTTYRLKTVTYGTASAPFLATRCIQQLAFEEKVKFPLAAAVALKDFYVDDLITGADSKEKTLDIHLQMINMLKLGGFHIRKWCTNDLSLLSSIPEDLRAINYEVHSDNELFVRSLGLIWKPIQDIFCFLVKPLIQQSPVTRRMVLSDIAHIFDPLGLIGPVILKAKIFLQQLWELSGDWDEPLPEDLHTLWNQFHQELPLVEKLKIPRWVNYNEETRIDIHGFCDASERGYGACIYIRNSTMNGIKVSLLCSKSRVAPLKKITLPRLELQAAVLLARLIHKISRACNFKGRTTLWSDSSIVLAWIAAPSNQWKTFVANRVAEINELTKECVWRHVRSGENPADHISRGMLPHEILSADIWWNGPYWLMYEENAWPVDTQLVPSLVPDRRTKPAVFLATAENIELLQRYSSLTRLQRVTAYCLRFVQNASKPSLRITGPLSMEEIHQALTQLIKAVQKLYFSQEILELCRNGEVGSKSRLKTLSPFLDSDNIIRVGGRINASQEPYSTKHPIVLPGNDDLSRLIAAHEHIKQLHLGPQALLMSLRQNFWLLNGRRLVRRVVHHCLRCFKCSPKIGQQRTGNLPKERVAPIRPFLNCGVDYCGPVYVKSSNFRGNKLMKSYIAVFVCFSTKAIHLELVGDLTTESFLGCLKRFMARRGKCANIYSDNATNFKGAQRELYELFISTAHETKLNNFLIEDNIKWHFIPPKSPHFGGLWEAAVKSVKFHLRRILGEAHLAYEEMYTCLTMIEACLNSRPLYPLSSDPNDLSPLTPGHFLIGTALTATADPDLKKLPLNRMSRWQYVQQLQQHFWSRWSKEYLTGLQQRLQWTKKKPNLNPGDLVLLKEDNLPPLKWHLGRVIEVFPGRDGLVRVAAVKTASGITRRAVSNLCPLPNEE